MPRNASGNYTLPAGNPVAPDTLIETTWANPTMADIATALTDSLSRSGAGGMLSPFKNLDGTYQQPGITWTNEPNTGFYRAGAQDMRVVVGGLERMRWTASGVQIWTGAAWESVATAADITAALNGYTKSAVDESISGQWTFAQRINTPGVNADTILNLRIAGVSYFSLEPTGCNVGVPLSQGSVPVVLQNRTIVGQQSLTGGGDLSANRSIYLVNDNSSPGASWYYGTNASGTKGWYPLSSVSGVPEAPIDGQTYARKDASWVLLASGGAYVLNTGDTMTGTLVFDVEAIPALALQVEASSLLMYLGRSDAVANAKYFSWSMTSNVLSLAAVNDAFSTFSNALAITRDVGAISAMVYGNATNLPTHTFYGTAAFNQAVTMAATLAVTGATTLTGALNGSTAQFSGQLTAANFVQSGAVANTFFGDLDLRPNASAAKGVNFYNAAGSAAKKILVGSADSLIVNGFGALWAWSDANLPRGKISISTTAPAATGNPGEIVLVYA